MAEAVQVLVALGWALAGWVVVLSAVGTVGVLAVVAAVWWMGRAVWRAIRARMPRRGPTAAPGTPDSPSRGSRDTETPPKPAERCTAPHVRT